MYRYCFTGISLYVLEIVIFFFKWKITSTVLGTAMITKIKASYPPSFCLNFVVIVIELTCKDGEQDPDCVLHWKVEPLRYILLDQIRSWKCERKDWKMTTKPWIHDHFVSMTPFCWVIILRLVQWIKKRCAITRFSCSCADSAKCATEK